MVENVDSAGKVKHQVGLGDTAVLVLGGGEDRDIQIDLNIGGKQKGCVLMKIHLTPISESSQAGTEVSPNSSTLASKPQLKAKEELPEAQGSDQPVSKPSPRPIPPWKRKGSGNKTAIEGEKDVEVKIVEPSRSPSPPSTSTPASTPAPTPSPTRILTPTVGSKYRLRIWDIRLEDLLDTGSFIDGQDPRLSLTVPKSGQRFQTNR